MAQPPLERSQNGKAEAVGSPEKDCLPPEESPLGKFRSLAGRLVNVDRVEFIEELRKDEHSKSKS
jgi:hypothetical protein